MEELDDNVVGEIEAVQLFEPTGSEFGKISIDDTVLAVIAHETAKKVAGVVELQGSLADGLAGMIGKKSKDRGIRVGVETEDLRSIDLSIIVEYGVCIPDVCVKLQEAVKNAVETMTGQNISAVNVVVQGVRNVERAEEE